MKTLNYIRPLREEKKIKNFYFNFFRKINLTENSLFHPSTEKETRSVKNFEILVALKTATFRFIFIQKLGDIISQAPFVFIFLFINVLKFFVALFNYI